MLAIQYCCRVIFPGDCTWLAAQGRPDVTMPYSGPSRNGHVSRFASGIQLQETYMNRVELPRQSA